MLFAFLFLISGEIQGVFIFLLFSIPLGYLGFGIDIQKKKKEMEILEANIVEPIQFIADGYHV